jgi:Protein of unknown function (DUF1176)
MLRLVLTLFVFVVFAGRPAAADLPLPRNLVEAGLKDPECTLSFEEATEELEEPEDLGEGKKLLEVPCWRAAYQMGSIFFVFDPANPDQAKQVEFRHWKGATFEQRRQISSPSFDAEKKRMTSFHKGRGLGDCGSSGAWVWNGSDFELEAYWLKNDCNGKRFNPEGEPTKWKVFPKTR